MTFSGQSKRKTLPPFSGRFLSFSHLPIFRSRVGHSISLVYLKFLTLSATNSKLLTKMQLSERQFSFRNHAEKVLTVTCLIAFCIQEGFPWGCLLCKLVEYNANNHLHLLKVTGNTIYPLVSYVYSKVVDYHCRPITPADTLDQNKCKFIV